MSVQAQWGTVQVEFDNSDPFGEETPIERAVHVPSVGLPIDVNAPVATLEARLAESLRFEAQLADRGALCDIKQHEWSTCFACPLYEGDGDGDAAKLCRLGREQDTILTLLAVRRHDGQRRQPRA